MKELKAVLKTIVDDLEKSAIAAYVLGSGIADKKTAKELAYQQNKDFYNSLRQQIDALPENQK